jgi:hypothetical protein
VSGGLNAATAEQLHRRLREFQNTYRKLKWGAARIAKESDPLLVEEGLAVYLWHLHSPPHGYKLAAAYCEHYDPRYGNGLNGPSCVKVEAIRDFVRRRAAQEAESTPTVYSEP